jgi:hypothetical protein
MCRSVVNELLTLSKERGATVCQLYPSAPLQQCLHGQIGFEHLRLGNGDMQGENPFQFRETGRNISQGPGSSNHDTWRAAPRSSAAPAERMHANTVEC